MKRGVLSIILAVMLTLVWVGDEVSADGIIIPDPCQMEGCPIVPAPCSKGLPCPPLPPPHPIAVLDIKYHHVNVRIHQQIAITRVDQVFYNPNAVSVEGTYLFPLPVGATVSKFTLWADGKPVDGKVLDAQEARKYYEETVRRQKDPALLEYVNRGAVQARIFPIPPKGERRIELEYSQVLTAESGLVRYAYPLGTEKFSASPIESVSISVEIQSDQPIRAVYSPSHPVSINRKDDRQALVGWEAKKVKPNQDFSLFYSVGESHALHLLSYRDPKDPVDPDGFFMLLLAPKPEAPKTIAKDVILVLDRSGSMEGEKFRQAQSALRYILQHLNPADRFGLVSFSTGIEPYARGLRGADEAAEAVAWVDRLSAAGSTDINRALLEALTLVDKERPAYLIFLTDGLPTTGETKRERILDNFSAAAPKNIRLFTFGVGYDVDTFLLDSLSQQHHGLSSYVKPSEQLDEILSAFYTQISTPVLTDLVLDFGSLATYDIYPDPLPDLFAGSQAVVVGRYRQGETLDMTLKGKVNGEEQSFRFPGQIFTVDDQGSGDETAGLPRLWATRKVGYLLNQVRLKGADQETISQIIKLSIRYGIVTPYTSYLVTEPMPLGAANQERLARDAYQEYQGAPTAAASGQGAVQKSAEQGALSQAQQSPQLPDEAARTVVSVGPRTFVYNQNAWIDTAYDPDTMRTYNVSFLSDEYFRLAQSRPDIAAALALGERVIVVVDGYAVAIAVHTAVQTVEPLLPTLSLTETQPVFKATSIPSLTPFVATSATPTTAEAAGSRSLEILLLALIIGFVCGALLFRRK